MAIKTKCPLCFCFILEVPHCHLKCIWKCIQKKITCVSVISRHSEMIPPCSGSGHKYHFPSPLSLLSFCLQVSLLPSYPLENSTELFSLLTCGSRMCTERSYVVDCCLRWSTAFLQLVNMFDLGIGYLQVQIIPCWIWVSVLFILHRFILILTHKMMICWLLGAGEHTGLGGHHIIDCLLKMVLKVEWK